MHMKDRIYAILHKTRREAYIGRTYRPLLARWAEHLEAAARSESTRTLYECLRHEPDGYDIHECECSETASEAQWVQLFTDEGYTILNDTGANRAAPKKRDPSKERAWREINLNAERAFSGEVRPAPDRLNKILAALYTKHRDPRVRFANI